MADAGWYPDPSGRHQVRWYDGAQWTAQVADDGIASSSPLGEVGAGDETARVVREEVAQTLRRAAPSAGTGDLFAEPVVVVHNLPPMGSCDLFDAVGARLGVVGRVMPQGPLGGLRAAFDARPPPTLRMDVYDRNGVPVLQLSRVHGTSKWTMAAVRPDGHEVGRIVQQQRTLTSLYTVICGETVVAAATLKGLTNFTVYDPERRPLANIRSTGNAIESWLSRPHTYVLELYGPLAEPLRTLVPVLPFVLDTAQAETEPRGNGSFGI